MNRDGHDRREVLRALAAAAGGGVLWIASPWLRRRGVDPRAVAARFGLRVVPWDRSTVRGPHDLAG